MATVALASFEDRLGETLKRALPKLGPEAQRQLAAFVTPQALAIVATVLAAWVVSHAFGVGQIVDMIIVGAGVLSIGLAVFTGIDHLYDFAMGAYRAKGERDLDAAADHFAKAVNILGITAVLSILFKGTPRTYAGGKINVGPAPASTPGIRFRPGPPKKDPALAAGEGATSFWGEITVATSGSATDKRLVLLHERVHQALTPKLYVLRNFRVENRAASYVNSSLRRYLEEALAETVAQVGVNGMRQFFTGINFPVKNGYVFLMKAGDAGGDFRGAGVLPETVALLVSGLIVHGVGFSVWFSTQPPPSS
jgi:hypothetical protein